MNKSQSKRSFIYQEREIYDGESSSSSDTIPRNLRGYSQSANRSSTAAKSRPLTERKRLSSNQNISSAGAKPSSKTPRDTSSLSGFDKNINLRRKSDVEKVLKSQKKKEVVQLPQGKHSKKNSISFTPKDQKLLDMEERVRSMQEHELNLIRELSQQQKIAKNALNKLYDAREDNPTEEAQQLKQYYKDYYARKLEEERSQYQLDIRKLQYENEKLLLELNNAQTDRYTEKTAASRRVEAELIFTTSELNQKTQENLDLRAEISRLKQTLVDVERIKENEIQRLRQTIAMLEDQNVQIKSEYERTDSEFGRNSQLENRVYELERELRIKTDEFERKAENLKHREYIAHQRVEELQKQAMLALEYQNTIQELRKSLSLNQDEILKIKNFYEEKLQRKRIMQESQRNEWSEIYNELRKEIIFLKAEIDSLANKKSKISY